MGTWFYPNPGLALDPLEPVLAGIGRAERGCTVHVFRNGGNGSVSPGPIAAGYDGVSSLPATQNVAAHYGAGVWWIDFASASTGADGIAEHPMSDWGNTRGWNVMPGAETWSAKESKGHIYAGDMTRGFDVYAFSDCVDAGCVSVPVNTAGSVGGGGQSLEEADFAWATRAIVSVADRHAKGRVVSSLEGGYDLEALGRSALAHVRALGDA